MSTDAQADTRPPPGRKVRTLTAYDDPRLRICEVCGIAFIPKPRAGDARYCGGTCRVRAFRRRQ